MRRSLTYKMIYIHFLSLSLKKNRKDFDVKKSFCLLPLICLVSCSTPVKVGSEASVALIYPEHPEPQDEKYMRYKEVYIFSFVDSDANQYITSWSGPTKENYNEERFKNITKKCSWYTHTFYPKDLTSLTPVLESELAYKHIATCIEKEGYKLENSRAHNPVEVVVLLGKQYSAHGESVKAGGRIRILSKGLQLADILPFAQACYRKSHEEYQQGNAANFIYIDMEPVVKGFTSCMRNKSFKIIKTENSTN